MKKNTLLGFVEIETPSGLVINDVALHEKNGKHWLSMPARAYEKNGEKSWIPYVKFKNRETTDKFQAAALPAVVSALKEAEGGHD
jgi:hypothetical protein